MTSIDGEELLVTSGGTVCRKSVSVCGCLFFYPTFADQPMQFYLECHLGISVDVVG